MATLVLSTLGANLFGPIGGFIGAMAGSRIDGAISSELNGYSKQPSRLANLKVQTSQDGAPMPIIYGKMCVAGNVIWATKFKETMVKRRVGGKTGQKVKELYYSISFAIGICEGPIKGIGKVWANGEELDLSQIEYRLYYGTENQETDPLIEAVEGIENTPNYKGMAYIVFEDLPLAGFGERIPIFSFEVYANPIGEGVEEKINGVCLIPGANEFAYATTPVRNIITKGKEVPLNQNQNGKTDFINSLDNLKRDLPNVNAVSLVATWFGTDLRAANCQILPKADSNNKDTAPISWSVAGLNRGNAQIVSNYNGTPAYGGAPSDASLIEAIIEMKNREIAVTLNPFIMMDIPNDNALPNPWGSGYQGAYSWRGRISCYPAPFQAGSVDGTTSATTQIKTFYGNVNASHFSVSGQNIAYSGPNEWSYSRFILHMAALAKAAGGVDTFLIGSELVGLSRVRDNAGNFPFVDKLVILSNEVRAILGAGTKISYAADWTEYGAYYHSATNNTYFPLDKLWANSNIDFVGIDYYAPISDRASNDNALSKAQFQTNIEGGEGYDYFYADETARNNRSKTNIADPVYNEPWIYRQKDIRNWWNNSHKPRINGVRQTTSTLWTAGSKPIRFMELGFPAIDKGGNRPSVFPDAKSIENGIPPFSNGKRDDSEQRNCLDAFLSYWAEHNQTASLYSGNMIDLAKTHIWAWDARPYPAFPRRSNLWGDAQNYAKGHWIMGRMGQVSLQNIFKDVANRLGKNAIFASDLPAIDGFIIDRPMSGKNILSPLLECYGVAINFNNDDMIFEKISAPQSNISISENDLIAAKDGSFYQIKIDKTTAISGLRFSCFNLESDYDIITTQAQNGADVARFETFSASIVTASQARDSITNRLLLTRQIAYESLSFIASFDLALKLEIGDIVDFLDKGLWFISSIEGSDIGKFTLSRPMPEAIAGQNTYAAALIDNMSFAPSPWAAMLDLPYPYTSIENPKPVLVAASSPWVSNIKTDVSGVEIASINKCAKKGVILSALGQNKVSQKLNQTIDIKLDFGVINNEANKIGILNEGQVVDIISFESATLIATDTYRLNNIVRGLNGVAIAPAVAMNCEIIVLDDALFEAELDKNLWGIDIDWRFSPENSNVNEIINRRFLANAALNWAPCHLRLKRNFNGIEINFTPRMMGQFDNWEMPDPLENSQNFVIEIMNSSGAILRTINANTNNYLYQDEITDFGVTQSNLNLRIAQIAKDGRAGIKNHANIVIE